MKQFLLPTIFFFLISSSFGLQCNFTEDSTTLDYICELSIDSSGILTVYHLTGYSDVNVTVIRTDSFGNVSNYEVLSDLLLSFLTNVKIFKLRRVNLTTIEAEAFENCDKMEEIDLNENSLTILPTGVFAKCGNLQKLSLSANKIVEINSEIFEGLEKLVEVNLSENEIEKIENSTFGGLSGLTTVNLSKNKLKTLNLEENLIKIINLSQNDLESFTIDGEIEEIDLSTNKFTEIPKMNFDKLKILKMSGNEIKIVTENSLKHAKKMEILDLSSCGLNSIDEMAFYTLDSLREVFLYHNNLEVISHAFMDNLRHLEVVDLSSNMINEGFLAISHLESLKSLKLSHNFYKKFPKFDQNLKNLEILDLSSNFITELSHPGGLMTIKELNLKFNNINSIQRGFFAAFPQLHRLIMTGNLCVDGEFTNFEIHSGIFEVCYENYENQLTWNTTTTEQPESEGISANNELIMTIICIIFIAVMILGLIWYVHGLVLEREGKQNGKIVKHVTFENNDMNYRRF